jgi:large conductance mechanosensitive channel
MYGNFLNALVGFLIVAAVVFFGIVKPMTKLKALTKKKEDEAPPPPPPAEVVLLTEIRDLLKNKA